jgi:probable F420-dependent oxidoreductase
MKFGVVYPQTEYGNDPHAIRDFAQSVEQLGYSHILAYEHVLGINPDPSADWRPPYTYQSPFQSPFLLFSYMAAVTQKVEFTTGILILPQRQTTLVAKQAATLDVLSGGRLRLGVGLGWNKPEYISLGENFHNRGRRIEEQITLMRQLWTQPLVQFTGLWHTIPEAGINPLPIQQPIPVWFGGHAKPVLRRLAAIGDGWMPNYREPQKLLPKLKILENFLNETQRDMSDLGLEVKIYYNDGDPSAWESLAQEWEEFGVSHITFNTMNVGFQSPDEHLDALQVFAATLGLNI